MKKALNCLALALVALLLFAACSTSNQGSQATSEEAQPSEAASEGGSEAVSEASQAAEAGEETDSIYIDTETFPGMMESTVSRTGLEAPPTKKEGTLRVGWCPSAMDTFYQRILSGMEEELEGITDVSIEIDVQAPSSQAATDDAVRIVENWITQGIDAICVSLSNESSLDPLMKQASEAGIPIFVFNSPEATNSYYVSNIGYDQTEGGRVMARWVGEHYKDAGDINAGFIIGVPGDIYTRMRMAGFNEVIAEYPNIHIIDEQAGNWVRADGVTATDDMLVAHPEMNALFSLFDEMALGGLQAIKAAGRTELDIVGYENMREVYDLILDPGSQYIATVDTGAKEAGRNIIRAVYRYCVEGEMIPKTVFVSPVAYDSTNMEEFPLSEYGNLED